MCQRRACWTASCRLRSSSPNSGRNEPSEHGGQSRHLAGIGEGGARPCRSTSRHDPAQLRSSMRAGHRQAATVGLLQGCAESDSPILVLACSGGRSAMMDRPCAGPQRRQRAAEGFRPGVAGPGGMVARSEVPPPRPRTRIATGEKRQEARIPGRTRPGAAQGGPWRRETAREHACVGAQHPKWEGD